jgi:hypothetical protein
VDKVPFATTYRRRRRERRRADMFGHRRPNSW